MCNSSSVTFRPFFLSLTAPSALFQIHFCHQLLPSISSLPCLSPCLLSHQLLTRRNTSLEQAHTTARSRPRSRAGGCREIKHEKKSESSSHNTQPCVHPSPTSAEGRQGADKDNNHLRQGKSHQRSHHHDEIQDVPEVSEVGAILQDQALINHLEGRYREKSRQGMSSSDIKWKGQAGGQGHCRHIPVSWM